MARACDFCGLIGGHATPRAHGGLGDRRRPMKKVNLKVGRNVFLYRDTDGSEVMVEVWAQQEDHPIGAGALYIESVDVATRPEAGDVWGPPLSSERV